VLALREHAATFSGVAGWTQRQAVFNAADTSAAQGVRVELVTPNFFELLGVRLIAGPGFARGSDEDADVAAVLSFDTARELYGSPSTAVHQRILIDGVPARVAGVAPERFQGAVPNNGRPALWLPLAALARIEQSAAASRWMDTPSLSVFARLAPSATHEQASTIASDVASSMLPDSITRLGGTRRSQVLGMRSGPPPVEADDGGDLLLITAASLSALLILLVACTNVSSLLVASAVGRRHEIAVRLSLGASRARLLRQLLTESVLLAVAGASLGLLLYSWATLLLRSRVASFGIEIAPDLVTVAFTVSLAVGTGILLGLSPALHATRGALGTALRDSGGGLTRRSRLQRGFVVAQILFSQPLLLVLAIAILSTIPTTRPIQPVVGDHVIIATFHPAAEGGDGSRRTAADSLAPMVARYPGVVSVVPDPETFDVRIVNLPRAGTGASDGRTRTLLQVEGVAPRYFDLLDVPIVLGRDVVLADTASGEYNIVIDTDIARTLWGSAMPIGRSIISVETRNGAIDSVAMRVVGVFDARVATTRGRAGHRVYTAKGKHWRRDALLIRTRGPAESFIPTLRTMLRSDAPGVPLARIETLSQVADRNRTMLRTVAAGFGTAGAVGLLLASLGLYSVIALAVGQRKREIGIRLTVGATPAGIASMFLGSGVRLAALGLVLGLPLSIAGFRLFMSSAFMELNVSIWLIGGTIAVLMLAVAAAATWMPARQAARLDPATTLRIE
jgi:predicted permease